MWVRIIAAFLVLALCLTLCIASGRRVFDVVDEMRGLCREAEALVDEERYERALETLERAEALWSTNRAFLEGMTPHEDLHDVNTQRIQAYANLELMDLDDFYLCMDLLDEELTHLREHETLSWSNLL